MYIECIINIINSTDVAQGRIGDATRVDEVVQGRVWGVAYTGNGLCGTKIRKQLKKRKKNVPFLYVSVASGEDDWEHW